MNPVCRSENERARGARMTFSRCIRILLLAIAASSLAACESDPSATAVSESTDPLAQVRLAIVEETRVDRAVSATGTLAADDQVVLGTKVAGRFSEITADLWGRAQRGEPIA